MAVAGGIMSPTDMHILLAQACDCVTFHGKGELKV